MAKFLNNGGTIPDACDCIWCGGKMYQGGQIYLGSGTNQFALFCDNCGAVVIHTRHFSKKINGFSSIEYIFENEQTEGNN